MIVYGLPWDSSASFTTIWENILWLTFSFRLESGRKSKPFTDGLEIPCLVVNCTLGKLKCPLKYPKNSALGLIVICLEYFWMGSDLHLTLICDLTNHPLKIKIGR